MKSFVFSFLFTITLTIFHLDSYQNATFFSKTFSFLIFSIFFGFSILWKFIKYKTKISISMIDFFVFIIFFFSILNNFNDINPVFSLRFYDLFSLLLFYFFIKSFLKTEKQFLFIVLGISFGIFINTLYGFCQYFGIFSAFHTKFHITGTFFNPAPFSGLISIGNILIVFTIVFREKFYAIFLSSKRKILFKKLILYGNIFAFSLNFILLIILKSRASILSFLIASLLLIFIKFKPKIQKYISKRVFIFFVFLLVSFSVFFLYFFRKNSADGRILVWKVSLEIIKNQPFIGVGFDKFKTHYMNYQFKYFSENQNPQEILLSDNIVYAFNDFIQFVVEQGFIGLFLLIFLLFQVMKKTKNTTKIVGILLIISLSVFACFSYPLQILPLKIIGICGFAISSFGSEKKWQFFPSNIFRFAVISLVCGFLIFQTNTIFQLHTGYKLWKNAMDSYFSNDFTKSVFYFEKAYPFLKTDGEFLMQYGKTLSLNEKPKKSNEILHQAINYLNNSVIQISLGDNYKSLKDYKNAEKHYKKASDMIPNRLYPVYLLAKMYEEKYDFKNARKQAKKLLQMPVKVPSRAVFEMQEEMKSLLNK